MPPQQAENSNYNRKVTHFWELSLCIRHFRTFTNRSETCFTLHNAIINNWHFWKVSIFVIWQIRYSLAVGKFFRVYFLSWLFLSFQKTACQDDLKPRNIRVISSENDLNFLPTARIYPSWKSEELKTTLLSSRNPLAVVDPRGVEIMFFL